MLDSNRLGMPAVNGYPALSFDTRLRLIKESGFQTLILWWGDGENCDRKERVCLAEKHGLDIEHAHGSTDALNALWLPVNEGNNTVERLKKEIEDCSIYGVKTLVLHLTNGSHPPDVSEIGIERIAKLVSIAEKEKVNLAFENIRVPQHLETVLARFSGSERVGFCYDVGHQHYWTKDKDWLLTQKERVFAIHLHDNLGDKDAHLTPLDGNINWREEISKITHSSYHGSVTLEAEIFDGMMKNSRQDDAEKLVRIFLENAYQRGMELKKIIDETT